MSSDTARTADRSSRNGSRPAAPSPTRSEVVYRELRRRILENDLPPGTVLPENGISQELGASRTPVRQALQQLDREGLVEIGAGRGAVVSAIALTDIIEMFQLRDVLEPLAAQLAASSPRRSAVIPLLDRLAQAPGTIAGDVAQYYALTGEIDDTLVALAANRRLGSALTDLWAQVSRARHLASDKPYRLLESVGEHVAILTAVRDGDDETAAAASRTHISRSLAHILSSAGPALTR